jgi:alpha-D-xyloside xylohydrolase
MDWDEESRSFTIGKRNGSFAGMEKTRTFSVNLMGETKSVEYNGKAVTVTF